MGRFTKLFAVGTFLAFASAAAYAQVPMATSTTTAPPPDRVLGKASAPVKVDEYISLTCSHCAEFYTETLPELEKRYVDTGKVKFVMHDFVLDSFGLKAAQVARCMPEEEFFPFIRILYQNQRAWTANNPPDKAILSYAKLGGLSDDAGDACLKDTKLQDSIVAERQVAIDKYKIEATPTFIFNDGAETIRGSSSVDDFAKVLDKLLAQKH